MRGVRSFRRGRGRILMQGREREKSENEMNGNKRGKRNSSKKRRNEMKGICDGRYECRFYLAGKLS